MASEPLSSTEASVRTARSVCVEASRGTRPVDAVSARVSVSLAAARVVFGETAACVVFVEISCPSAFSSRAIEANASGLSSCSRPSLLSGLDSCWSPNLRRKDALEDYRRMRDALAEYAPNVHYSLCGWSSWYAPAVSGEEGYHSWRISADCDEFANIYEAARTMEQLSDYAGPAKGYNDPDMLVGTSTGAVTLTPTQSRTQFDLWCVLAAPLLLGTNPSRMNAWDLETYGDTEVIAIDQDPLGKQGTPVSSTCPPHTPKDNWWCSPWSMPRDVFEVWTGLLRALAAVLLTSSLFLRGVGRPRAAAVAFILAIGSVGYVQVLHTYRPRVAACQQVWAKPLVDGDVALLFVNWAPDDAAVACDAACLDRAGLTRRPLYVREVRARANRAPLVDGASALVQRVGGGGGSVLFRVGL